MDDFTIARALHVLAVLMWIGGVGFVTCVVMPSVRRSDARADWLPAFARIERGFAPQARLWVLLAGASGFWMIYRGQMWDRFEEPRFWWMHAMVCLWLFFAAMLFVVEPLLRRRSSPRTVDPAVKFQRLEIVHRVLLILALVTVLGAVAGSHGLF
jgi:uncharacterized membrane protein